MPIGTAEKHLRKSIIHELAKQLGKGTCCRCNLEIEDPDDLAIIHVQDWEEKPDLFWALTNVAFSHASCEATRSGKRQREKKMSKVEIKIEKPNGQPLAGSMHKGSLYVAGKKGERYQIKARNKTDNTVLVVLTVDGRNITTGEPGDHHDAGHVLQPKSSWTFKGWRTSDEEVAAFEFGSKAGSYSNQMGSPENVGVIGVAVFEEKEVGPIFKTVVHHYVNPGTFIINPPWPSQPPWGVGDVDITCGNSTNITYGGSVGGGSGLYGSSGGIGACSSNVSSSSGLTLTSSDGSAGVQINPGKRQKHSKKSRQGEQRLGTGFGETLESQVEKIDFKRATDDPCEVYVIRYDSMGALRERGIMVRPSEKKQEAPQAFPENSGYCQPPPRTSKQRHG